MKFQFDPNQDFQKAAVAAAVDLFDGQPNRSAPEFRLWQETDVSAVGNTLDLDDRQLLKNLHTVQDRNGISRDPALRELRDFPNFSVEMETGTGKTYVYIRTALELFLHYGFRKYVIVVPSVAVREGVLKTLDVTREHFRGLYDNPAYNWYRYDSTALAGVRQFAHSSGAEFLVTTIDSFNKAVNVMVRAMDQMQGQTPIHLVQATRPILILDEPQNLEGEKAQAALAKLQPLFALRYSATHRDPYNLIYRLTPYEAYQRRLVKRITVASVVKNDDANHPFVSVVETGMRGRAAIAKLRVHRLMKNGTVKEKLVTVKPGDKLAEKTGRPEYSAFDIDEIDPVDAVVRFAPANVSLREHESVGVDKDAIFKAQIRHTVRKHIETQKRARPNGIKVLSLFFIDRVDNYAAEDGIIRRLFREAFDEMKSELDDWRGLTADDVQAAYFASKRRRSGEIELLESATGEAGTDEEAYDLIMRDKEALLSFPSAEDDDEAQRKKRVCFIFSHSALREGWDSPNVFQICTLNQSVSTMRKRQEVGRGVRLAVDQAGERAHDDRLNVLTVIANESYERYVAVLQSEIADDYQAEIEARYGRPIRDLSMEERVRIAEEYGPDVLPPPPRPADRPAARLDKARVLSPEFNELWERIKHKTRYAVAIDTDKVLTDVVQEIDRHDVEAPRVTITEAQAMVREGQRFTAVATTAARTTEVVAPTARPNVVSVMAHLMDYTTPRVCLTRRTLLEVVKRVERPERIVANPYEFARVAVGIIKDRVVQQLVDGIKYEKVDGEWWEMRRILDEDVMDLFSRYVEPAGRSLYDSVPCDSKVEQRFVRDMEQREDVRFYMKLPSWFSIRTPIGDYRPDWAVVVENPDGGEPLLYLVAETKGTPEERGRRTTENLKIECARAHFGSKERNVVGALEGLDYKVVTTGDEIP